MSSKYEPLLDTPGGDDFDRSYPKPEEKPSPSWTTKTVLLAVSTFFFYTLAVVVVTEYYFLPNQPEEVAVPLSSFPHPNEMQYVIQPTGEKGTALERLAFDLPSPEVDDAWFALLEPFNTRVPPGKFEPMNRSSIQVTDDSGDYYVTLTMYHEIHCLMRIRWFLYPSYYLNKTWEEQAQDRHTMGHFKHCIWSLLESVLCHADTSIRTFHWEENKSAPVADSYIPERKCVNREWLYEYTSNYSFALQDRLLAHPIFGELKEDLSPVRMPEGYTLHEEESE
ncbi:hypothetical protein V8F20_011977 [Naviculisporaceae sp. PSN 640]